MGGTGAGRGHTIAGAGEAGRVRVDRVIVR
jgi:hypothetical protein